MIEELMIVFHPSKAEDCCHAGGDFATNRTARYERRKEKTNT